MPWRCCSLMCFVVLGCGDAGTSAGGVADAGDEPDVEATPDATVAPDAGTPDAALPDGAPADTPEVTEPPGELTTCAAIRGNGELITAHFAALARIVETFGPLDGVAGGSSASISAFLTESVHMHPGTKTCGGAPCSKAEAGARLGLLYKSLFGYLAAMTERDEAVALATLLAIVEQAQAEGIGALIEGGNLQDAYDALVTLVTSEDVKDLVNGEILDLLLESPDPLVHVAEVWAAIQTLGSFSAPSTVIFLRPGLVSFSGFAEKLGRIASFYAAYGPADLAAWEVFLGACAVPGRGLHWPAVAALDGGGGETCGQRFHGLLSAWRASFVPEEHTLPNRIDDLVGAHMRALAITSALTGPAAAAWEAARTAYVAAETWSLELSFDDVRVGYWGAPEHTAAVVANARGYDDLKTSKTLDLGQVTWRQALSLSPAEPGLARAFAMSGDRVSAGGWPDLEPVLALRNAGCDRVIYVTRRGPASPFARAVAALAGMTPEQDAATYDLGNDASSFTRSLAEAAAVWCTDWNAFGATQLSAIMEDAYGAPMELHDPSLVPVAGDYPTATSDQLDIVGCTPGVGD